MCGQCESLKEALRVQYFESQQTVNQHKADLNALSKQDFLYHKKKDCAVEIDLKAFVDNNMLLAGSTT